jgi:HEAT repeat protein/putative zinc finger protein
VSDKQRNAQPAGRTGFSLLGLNPAQTKTDGLKPVPPVRCEDIESLAVLYACDELDAGARAELEAHLAACPSCAAVVSREARLQQAVASLEQPADSLDRSGLLLAQCRSQLAESLDDQQARANRSAWRSVFSPVAWWGALRHTLIYHPAMSMTFLVVAGFLAGVAGQRLRVVPSQVISPRPAMTVSASPKITDQQLQSAGSAHVAWVTPSGSRTPTVQVQLMSQTPMNIVGAPDDADVERALTFVLENSQRFDPDARLDSLDVLRTRAADPAVRRSLCAAARLDRNPGVRMKAIEALQGFEQDPAVRQTLLDALQSDDNSGVRVEAINLLVSALQSNNGSAAPDTLTLEVLRDRLRNDPNNYVRLQSAAALRELGEQ